VKVINSSEIKNLDERTVAYVRFVGNYIGNSEVFKGLFEKLCGWAGPKGLIRKEIVFLSCYHDDPKITPPEKLTVDVCMNVDDNVEVEGEVKKKILPGGKYAVIRVELDGPQEYGAAWGKIVEWMKENNVEIDMSRPSYEIYLNDPKAHPENHHILDVCMSAK
jgi:AraC family transcriptional regulator